MSKINTINPEAIVKVEFSGAFLMQLKELMFIKLEKYQKDKSEEDVKLIFENIKENNKQADFEAYEISTLFVIISAIESKMEEDKSFIEKSLDDYKKEIEENLPKED